MRELSEFRNLRDIEHGYIDPTLSATNKLDLAIAMGTWLSRNRRADQLDLTANDAEIAEKLQIEELLRIRSAADELPLEPFCACPCDLCNGRVKDSAMRYYVQPLPSAPPLVEEAYCAICMEVKHPDEFVGFKSCAHQFCSPCVRRYVSVKLDDSVFLIGCPEPGCRRGMLDPGGCQAFLPRDTFERWCRVLCESMVGSKFYCPYSDCRGLLEGGGEDELVVRAECPHCERLFCAQCMVPWHDGVDCEDVRRPGEDDESARGDLLLSELADKLKWQRCPQCKIIVERIDGCRLMKCRCGHCFCYICASPMSEEEHYCYKCQG